jgi:MFS family permease
MSTRSVITAMCVAEALGMLGFATFQALLPTFLDEWSLSGTEAGWLSGLFFAGYTVAVAVLTSLTDRIDARRIYIWSALLTGVSTLAFAFFANDFWTAAPLRVLAGAGLAGTYMPGLKALTDRIPESSHPRAVSFYTSSFGVGTSFSYLFAGLIAEWLGWRWAFGLSVIGTVAGLAVVIALFKPKPVESKPTHRVLDFRPVFRNREAMAYILSYAAHNWELFGFRSWIVAFLVFCLSLRPDPVAGILTATAVAAGINLLGMPSSVIGNEFATRFGRRRMVGLYMSASAVLGCLVGFTSGMPYLAVVVALACYGITVTSESASVTTGTMLSAAPERKGAAMAVHSLIGFAFSFLGSLAPGITLDLAGGTESGTAWVLAFMTMAAGVAFGPIILFTLARGRARPS